MWYAIEYAYGSRIINNDNRGDRVLEFTSKRLRDAWANGGSFQDGPGYRETISARDPAVRKADGLADGDGEAWQTIGTQRISDSAALRKHRGIISYDWAERDHWHWVATAPEREIVSWAVETEKNS